MRIPQKPPDLDHILRKLIQSDGANWITSNPVKPTDYKGRYLHWDELRLKPPPTGLNPKQHWLLTKIARNAIIKQLPFLDKNNQSFKYCIPDPAAEMLHQIDQNASGGIRMAEAITNEHTRNVYLINSLMEEAIHSSQLEGAVTTRKEAKQMLRQKRKPRAQGERMIFNNYAAMEFVREAKNDPLTPAMILELHRVVTRDTLSDPGSAGRLRLPNEQINVIDHQGQVLHNPPVSETLPKRLELLCNFANQEKYESFIHPVVKAILLHFILAYDHPFVDGNGRTARALFYWSMVRQGYWLAEFLSISQIIKQGPAKYGRAFLYTTTDDNDVTYFIMHQLKVIIRAIEQLYRYLERKTNELKSAAQLIEKTRLKNKLNHRQLAILDYALRHPAAQYQIKEHQTTHNIAYQTARTDLLKLAELGLLLKIKEGLSHVFVTPTDLKDRLTQEKVAE